MIRVHHLNNSRSQRVLWLLEETGTPYEIVRYERDKQTMLAPKELRRVHPLGKSPIIEDDDKKFAETGLIVEYLVERYGSESGAVARFRALLALQILAALRRRLADAAAAAQAVVDRLGLLALPARGFVRSQLKLHLDYLGGELTQRRGSSATTSPPPTSC